MAPPSGKPSDVWGLIGYYSSLGFILPAATLAGYAVGWAVDRWLGTKPVLSVVFTVLGLVAGFLELFRMIGRAEKDIEE